MSETKLLYRAIRELAYIQETGHECISNKRPDLVITSEGASIVMEGMALLGVKDLAADELPDVAPDPRIAAADAMAKALEGRIELACRGTCDRALDWHTPECESARAALAAYNALQPKVGA